MFIFNFWSILNDYNKFDGVHKWKREWHRTARSVTGKLKRMCEENGLHWAILLLLLFLFVFQYYKWYTMNGWEIVGFCSYSIDHPKTKRNAECWDQLNPNKSSSSFSSFSSSCVWWWDTKKLIESSYIFCRSKQAINIWNKIANFMDFIPNILSEIIKWKYYFWLSLPFWWIFLFAFLFRMASYTVRTENENNNHSFAIKCFLEKNSK